MDQKFLDFYNRELTFMKEMSGEFAEKHPKIAGRLGMNGIEVADPYVERLIEAFCFISARSQVKLDAEFPKFTQRFLDVIYPNYNAQTPSMGVIQLHPNTKEGDLSNGYHVPKNSQMFTRLLPGEQSRCEFRSSQDLTLWPVEIEDVRLTSIPPDISSLEKYRISYSRLKGALRIKLKLDGDNLFSQLENLDKLPFYIDGDERVVSHIFELIHAHYVAMIIRSGGSEKKDTTIVNGGVSFEGLQPDQALLPVQWNMFHGHNLVQEYFSCRQRFYFFTLNHLRDALRHNDTNEAEIIILLDRFPQDLISHIDKDRFLLFCTPVINLFPKRIDKIEINRVLNDFHVVPDRSRPLDYEVFSVRKVMGQQAENSSEVIFNPIYQTRHSDSGNFGRYFSLRRETRANGSARRKYETLTPYIGTEVFISLVDQQEAPFDDDIRYLSVEAMVTNRDLPRLIDRSNDYDLTLSDSVPVYGANFLSQPSPPHPPFARGESAWRLIRQLSFNYLPLHDMDHNRGGESLRNLLRLFVSPADQESMTQIDSLVGSKTKPVVRRLPGNELLVYGRGVQCVLTVDEVGFSGLSPYLFGLVMENYLSRHAAVNVFTETELHSMQRGLVAKWAPRPGKRGIL
ncbi:type VI secretion system baseplate subunit TssF [Morganella morganii]|uniref:type VI secretion system baseplate subunit TssF n=1 Tax=Morganella morganii TaxID=582 RepID=UPI00141911D3|nr:type VI secretion system baseplate subunit TssF [Morganella morganii]